MCVYVCGLSIYLSIYLSRYGMIVVIIQTNEPIGTNVVIMNETKSHSRLVVGGRSSGVKGGQGMNELE
jgi:hypothetical protein